MNHTNRGRVTLAVLLILFGGYLLAIQFFPALRIYALNESNRPLLLIGIGGIILLLGLLTSSPGMMIPAAVIGGIGGILYWQNLTNDWDGWAYMWTLIPGFVGIGIFLMHLMQGNLRRAIISGGVPIIISLAAFLIFSTVAGATTLFALYWPLLLVLLGVILLAQTVRRRAS